MPIFGYVSAQTNASTPPPGFHCSKQSHIATPPSIPGVAGQPVARNAVKSNSKCANGEVLQPDTRPAPPGASQQQPAKGNPLFPLVVQSLKVQGPRDFSTRALSTIKVDLIGAGQLAGILSHETAKGPSSRTWTALNLSKSTSAMLQLPSPVGSCQGTLTDNHCYYYAPVINGDGAIGAGMQLSVEKPKTMDPENSGDDGHSLTELSVQGGPKFGNIVEIGWSVSQAQFGDSDPHLFVYHWKNWGGTCYNTCGWTQVSNKYVPGQSLAPLLHQKVSMGYTLFNGNWWAFFDGEWLGYFSGKEWKGQFTQSTLQQWFAEVVYDAGTPPRNEMGSGVAPKKPGAAEMSQLCVVRVASQFCSTQITPVLRPNATQYYDLYQMQTSSFQDGGPVKS